MSQLGENFIDETLPVGMEISLSATITDQAVSQTLIGLLHKHQPSIDTGLLKGLDLNQVGFFDTAKHHEVKHRAMLAMIDHCQTHYGDQALLIRDLQAMLVDLLNPSYTRVIDTRVTGAVADED